MSKISKPDPDYSAANPTPETSSAPYRVYNIGNNQSVELNHFIELLEKGLGMKAQKKLLPIQPGDVEQTYADIETWARDVDFAPGISIEMGIKSFLAWYREYQTL